MRIISNKAKCLKCGNTIESIKEYEYKICSCGAISIDGGTSRLRRSCTMKPEDIEELSETISEVILSMNQYKAGYEITLIIEKDVDEELSLKAGSEIRNIITHASIENKMIFQREFIPYKNQNYELTFMVEHDYDVSRIEQLAEELKKYDSFNTNI